MNLLNNKDIVLKLLSSNSHLRDDDSRLITNIWYKTLINNNINPKELSAYEFLELLNKGLLPNAQSIRRVRRKLQEVYPELQGKLWAARHSEEKNVKKQLKDLVNS